MTIMSSRRFNQDTGGAKIAAKKEPVIITTRGQPSHVLITIEEYDRLRSSRSKGGNLVSLAEALADNDPEADFEFDIPEFKETFKAHEFD